MGRTRRPQSHHQVGRDLALRAAWLAADPERACEADPLLVRNGRPDLFYPNLVMADGMHDWVLSAERMAKALADKGYHYQFLFARNSKHVDRPTVAQTLPSALEWLWKGHPIP
jgi:hypothetical protein